MNTNRKASIMCLLVLVGLWELFARIHTDVGAFIPTFSEILNQPIYEMQNLKILEATYISLSFVAKGYIVSIMLAFLAAVFCRNFNIINILFSTLYKVLSPLPSVAVLPIILLVTGLNENSIILLIIHSVFWPTLASNISGFACIPTVFEDFSCNINLSILKRYLYVYLPAAFPHIMTGLRTSWGRAWRSLISAEAIFGISGATQGIGYYIYYNRAFANMANVFASIIVICLISLIAEEVFSLIERHTLKKWGMSK